MVRSTRFCPQLLDVSVLPVWVAFHHLHPSLKLEHSGLKYSKIPDKFVRLAFWSLFQEKPKRNQKKPIPGSCPWSLFRILPEVGVLLWGPLLCLLALSDHSSAKEVVLNFPLKANQQSLCAIVTWSCNFWPIVSMGIHEHYYTFPGVRECAA